MGRMATDAATWRRLVRLAAAGGVLALAAPLAESFWWVLGLPAHFPLQAAALALACGLLAAALREKAATAALAVVLVASVVQARDYLPRFATAEAAGPDLTVVTLNLDWRNPDPGRAGDWLRRVRADLVILPEYTPAAARSLAGLADVYPHRLEESRAGAWGIGLLSRHPIAAGQVIYPGGVETPVIDAAIELDGLPLRLLGVHPRSPISGRSVAERDAQLLALAALVAEEERATLVCGDFNDTPFSAGFRAFTARSGLANAAAGLGYPATFPAGWAPVWIPIDHCLYRGRLRPVRVQSGPHVGSDHYPLVAEFVW
jgi:endonuclease/exonuclease/phosphatase (EEP) superfamily protein YafD